MNHLHGRIVDGKGGAADVMRSRPLTHWALLGYVPWPGTLNLQLDQAHVQTFWRKQDVVRVGKADYVPVWIGRLPLPGHARFSAQKDQLELLAPVELRKATGPEGPDGIVKVQPRRRSTRAIIQAAGTQRRWNNHLEVPKHLVPVPRFNQVGKRVEDEQLLQRTVRLLRETGIRDIVVVGPEDDDRYQLRGGAELVMKDVTEGMPEADAWLPVEAWHRAGRTLFLSGDMYYTTRTLRQMVAYELGEPVWYLRHRDYEWRGWTRSKAILGLSLQPGTYDGFYLAVTELEAAQASGRIDRSAGYELYRWMHGATLEELRHRHDTEEYSYPSFEPFTWHPEPDDATHDFDWPRDYNRFLQRFNPETDL